MGFYIQYLVDALSLGSLYALMALGLVIVNGILKLVNFAYGELIMIAGYSLFLLGGGPLPWLVMALVAVVMAILGGILTEYAAFRPVRSKSVTAVLITIATAVVMLALFCWLMRRTVLGLAMRAAATRFTMARMLGIPANLVITSAFAISGLLAGVTTLNHALPPDLLKFKDTFTFSLVILILLWWPDGLIKGPATGQRT